MCIYIHVFLYIRIYILHNTPPCGLVPWQNEQIPPRSREVRQGCGITPRVPGDFSVFKKTWGVPRFFFCREWMMSNEKSRNLGGVDVFFVSNMFFFDCGFNPNAWGDDPIWRCPLDGLKLPTWNSWGISKKKGFTKQLMHVFLKQEFWMFKRTSYVDTPFCSRWL